MAVEAVERDFSLSTVFWLTVKTLLRRPITGLLLAAVTVTLPAELYFRLVPYVPQAFSVSFALYTIGSFAAYSPAAILTGWMALEACKEERPLGRAINSAVSVTILYFIVTIVGTLGMLLIIPGIWWSLATAVAVPAAVVERLGIRTSLLRSFLLTEDRKAMILVISTVVISLPVILVVLLDFALNGWRLLPAQDNPITNITRPITSTLVTMWISALTVALYIDLVRVVDRPAADGGVAKEAATG